MDNFPGEIEHVSFCDVLDQKESVLFQLPGEVRQSIYYHTLASFEDKSRIYDRNTYWSRPQYLAPRRSDTTLLRCCKRIYNEGWFIPFVAAEHTFWLTTDDRAPEGRMNMTTFENILGQVYSHHGDVEIGHLRFFAQMWALEPGYMLQRYLGLSCFHPQQITVTARHTDWWYWESDVPLKIKSGWVNECVFPASVRQVRMELESLERKKNQVDSIVRQMKEHWWFRRSDDVFLSAQHTEVEVTRWKGTSTWSGQRWIRDETEPEILNYYVATVTWEREPEVEIEDRDCPDLELDIPHQQLQASVATIPTGHLELAKVPPGCSGAEALILVEKALLRLEDANTHYCTMGDDRDEDSDGLFD